MVLSEALKKLNFFPHYWRHFLAMIGGILFPLSFSPFDFDLVIFISLFLFLKSLVGSDLKTAFFVGWIFGMAVFGLGVGWIQISIHQFGIPYWAFSFGLTFFFVALMAIYYAILGQCVSLISVDSPLYIITIPCLWFLSEYVRSNFLTGFPWLLVGYTQLDGPLKGFIPLVGSIGCSGLVVFIAATLFWSLKSFKFRWSALVSICFLVFFSSFLLQNVDWTETHKNNLQVALVQGAIPQEIKWDASQLEGSIQRYLDLTQEYWEKDLIIWPETALPIFPENVPNIIEMLSQKGSDTSTVLLIGAPTKGVTGEKYFNSILQLGSSSDSYSKRKLVPYGEYFPGKNYFRFFHKYFLIPMSDLSSGDFLKNSLSVKGREVGILICYEVAFTDIAFSSLPKSHFLVNVSNDAWFGNSIAPFQHLQIARVRALESGRPILRATNDGLTALIDHKGGFIAIGPQFNPVVVSGTVFGRSGTTPYLQYGDYPVLYFSVFIIFLLLYKHFRFGVDSNH